MVTVEFDSLFAQSLSCYLYCPIHCFPSPLNHFEPLFNDIEAVPELKRTFFLPLTEDPNYSEKKHDKTKQDYKIKIRRIMALQTIKKTLLQPNRSQYVLIADVYADFFLISSNCRLYIKETKQDSSFLKYSDDLEEKVQLFLVKVTQAYALKQYEHLLSLSRRYEESVPVEDPFEISLRSSFFTSDGAHAPAVRSHTISIEDPDIRSLLTMDSSGLLRNDSVVKILTEVKEQSKKFYPLTSTYREPSDFHLFLLSNALQAMPSDSYKGLILHVSRFLTLKAVPCNLSELDLSDLPYHCFWTFFTRALEYARSSFVLDLIAAVDKHSERSSNLLKKSR